MCCEPCDSIRASPAVRFSHFAAPDVIKDEGIRMSFSCVFVICSVVGFWCVRSLGGANREVDQRRFRSLHRANKAFCDPRGCLTSLPPVSPPRRCQRDSTSSEPDVSYGQEVLVTKSKSHGKKRQYPERTGRM